MTHALKTWPEYSQAVAERGPLSLLLPVVYLLIFIIISGCVTHRPRYDKYDRNGLLKSSTPLFLDKSKGRKTNLRTK